MEKAKIEISNDPMDRVSDSMKKILKEKKVFLIFMLICLISKMFRMDSWVFGFPLIPGF
jgi:hypothetical protein